MANLDNLSVCLPVCVPVCVCVCVSICLIRSAGRYWSLICKLSLTGHYWILFILFAVVVVVAMVTE